MAHSPNTNERNQQRLAFAPKTDNGGIYAVPAWSDDVSQSYRCRPYFVARSRISLKVDTQ
jgi:hypothetical protein